MSCSDSDDSGSGNNQSQTSPETTADGLWEGTFTEEGVGTFDVTGLLYNGRIIAIITQADAVYDGSYTLDDNSMSGTVTAYEANGGAYATATLSGTVTSQDTVSLDFETTYDTTGTITLDFDSIYNRSSSSDLVEGTWSYSAGAYSLTLTVQSDGTFFGQDSGGCAYTGTIAPIDTSHNLYDTDVTIESCGSTNGGYSGFAGLFDNTTTNDTLQTAVSNDNYLFLYPFTRQ